MKPTDEQQTAVLSGVGAPLPYALRRLGIVMRPESGALSEAGGVLNPAGVRGKDGHYYLFPRLVASGNYSRIGVARVLFDREAVPTGVERLGIAMEPEAPYEMNRVTGGGCEDPRIVWIEALGLYAMTYAAFGPTGPHAALALSADLSSWTRCGLIDFAPLGGVDMNGYGNKDAMIFPDPVPGPDGKPALALLHRPMYELWDDHGSTMAPTTMAPPGIAERRWSMWISFCPLERIEWSPTKLQAAAPLRVSDHSLLIAPEHDWEVLRIGGGTPPIRLPEGWFTIYHGICATIGHGTRTLRYSAGALVLDPSDPRRVLYRSPEPTLEPELEEERSGVVANVVFPTAVDQHSRHLDVYYGMADACIGVARMDLAPDTRGDASPS